MTGGLVWLERNAGVKASGLIAVAVAVAAWLAGYHFGGRALYLLAYGSLAMLGVSVYLARRRRPVEAERSELAHRARVGQVLNVEISLRSRSRASAFRVEDTLHRHLGPSPVFTVSSIAPGDDVRHRYTISPPVRGVFAIGPLVAEFSDPMGLAKRRQVLIPESELIVHPRVEDVLDRPLTRAFEDPPLRPPKSRRWPTGIEFYGMRDYVRGDDLRRVVWRAFARTDRLLVREYEQGVSDRITIVLDTDQAWHSRGDPSETFETAVRVAASVGVRHLKDGFSVRLMANYDQLGKVLRGPRGRIALLDELARVQMTREPLADAIQRLAKANRRDDHVVLITSRLDARSAAGAALLVDEGASFTVCDILWDESDPSTQRRALEIGAQLVQVKPAASLSGVFRASLQRKQRAGSR